MKPRNGWQALAGNLTSLTGVVLVAASAVLFLGLFLLDLLGYFTNPYFGLLTFIALPSVFVLGLVLVPIGLAWGRRRGPSGRRHWPHVDLNEPTQRRMAAFIFLATTAWIVILSMASYGGIHYLDSVAFCGQVCHEVMQPEFVAYQDGPHSRVPCVQCHIGAGAPWFVRAKLSGLRQVVAVMANTFSRPVPSPVENLRPARDTCEQCHWPEKFHGDKLLEVREYADDEANSESVTSLRIHVGGGSVRQGIAAGIHWHMSIANEIEYIAIDDRRQVIPWVRLRDRFGTVREFQVEGIVPEQLDNGERRQMDCMDCHNRPSHPFASSSDRAVDGAIEIGDIPGELPFIRREAVVALTASYSSQTTAFDAIAVRLRAFFREEHPDVYMAQRQEVERAVAGVQNLYRRNVFPSMDVQWGTYPNNIGHMDFPGCFRCHDDSHVAENGDVIRQDCDLCHDIEFE